MQAFFISSFIFISISIFIFIPIPLSILVFILICIGMGRAKLQLELIKKEKCRTATFNKRKKGLMKKMHEFATLCDVDACMIIYNNNNNNENSNNNSNHIELETWPSECSAVAPIVCRYKSLPPEERSRRTVDLSFFYKERLKKVDSELARLRSSAASSSSSSSSSSFSTSSSRYLSWDSRLEILSVDQMSSVASTIDSKLQHAMLRLGFLQTHDQQQQQQQLQEEQERQDFYYYSTEPQALQTSCFYYEGGLPAAEACPQPEEEEEEEEEEEGVMNYLNDYMMI